MKAHKKMEVKKLIPIEGKRIAIVGAGAIGGSVGLDLIEAGLDVTLVDQWPAHVEAMRANGLTVQMPSKTLHVDARALHLCDLSAMVHKFDIALLAVKAYDTRWSAELIKMHLKPDGFVVGLQNSMCNDEIAVAVGRARTIGGVVELSAELFTPGVVHRNTPYANTWFGVGALDEHSNDSVAETEKILSLVGRVAVIEDVTAAKWAKLIANSMMLGPFGILGVRMGAAVELPGLFETLVEIGKEAIAVASALGYTVHPVCGLRADELVGTPEMISRKLVDTIIGHIGPNSLVAPLQDHRKGRYSEVDCINGLIAQHGREVGILTPFNQAIVEITHRIRNGELQPDPNNLAMVRRLV